MTHHEAEIRWQRGAGEAFTDRRYSRAHRWRFDGGAVVPASSSPHGVPVPFSRPEHVDPEEALVAAAASCHMLTVLFLAAKRGYVVDQYVDAARGEMGSTGASRAALVRITLRPAIVFSGARVPDDATVEALHHEAHAECIIANSLRATIDIAGSWRHVGEATDGDVGVPEDVSGERERMTDLAIALDDRPGALAAMGAALGRAGVSIEGGGAWVVGGRGVGHFLFADGAAARRALAAAGIRVLAEREVLAQRLRQAVPGQLGALTRRMADAGVNIEVLYSDHDHRLILVVDDLAAGRRVSEAWTRERG